MNYEKRLIIWSVIGTGISSIAVQLVTVREFITQFHGNEITISLVLFSWLLLTCAGSILAGYIKLSSITIYFLITLIIALWPLPQLLSIRYLREVFLTHGASPGFYPIFIYITLVIAPYCILVGYVLPSALDVLRANHHDYSTSDLYITDSIGDISGGVLFSFILVYLMKPFRTIAVTSSLLILIVLLILLKRGNYRLLISSMILTGIFYSFALDSGFEQFSLSKQYGNIKEYVESPFGRVVITGEEDQHTFWESGIPLYSSPDIIESEEKVHYPLCQIDGDIQSVMVVSGGIGETLNEINLYNPDHIDYVELDPLLTNLAFETGFIPDLANLRVINRDARAWIKTGRKKYDAIIVDLPDPDTFQVNRFFTSEFFALAEEALKKDGILSFGMNYSSNFISETTRKKLSTVYNSAKQHFRHITVIPGERAYFLCRESLIHTDIPERLKLRKISTEYIEGYYHGNVTAERLEHVRNVIDTKEYINTDFEPRMINIVFKEWFLKHGTSSRPFLVIMLAVMGAYLITLKKEEYVLFSTGLAAMGVETLIIYTFQIIYGYVYLKIGAIVTIFLIGLLPGAVAGGMRKGRKGTDLLLSDLLMIFTVMIYYIWVTFVRIELHQYLFLIYGFLFSFICGFQFPAAARIIGEKTGPAAGCLAADLAGAAAGTFIVGTLLIPLYGIQTAVLFVIMVKISSSMIILYGNKRGL